MDFTAFDSFVIRNHSRIVTTGIVAFAVWGAVSYYFSRNPYERDARLHVEARDAPEHLCLEEVLADDASAQDLTMFEGPDTTKRFRPKNQLRLAVAVADEAYYQFGFRPMSEANVLITRKFMRDRLMEVKGLRAHDALLVIDKAIPLSFLPSLEFKNMVRLMGTDTFERRLSPTSEPPSWWRRASARLSRVFGGSTQ